MVSYTQPAFSSSVLPYNHITFSKKSSQSRDVFQNESDERLTVEIEGRGIH
jgi:hypothetical protein